MTDSPPFASVVSRPLFHLLIILAVGAAAYSLSLDAPFVFDDRTTIVDNPAIRDVGKFLDGTGFQLHPRRFVGYLTFALNYHVAGLHVRGYHLVNVVIHVMTAWLTYAFCLLTLRAPLAAKSVLSQGAPYVALLAGLLFVAHPVQTESVVYITQRFSSLATLFYVLSLVVWVRWRVAVDSVVVRTSLVVAAAVAAGAAMLTKEIAVTLPLAALFYDTLFIRSPWYKRVGSVLPLAAPVAAVGALWVLCSSSLSWDGVLRHLDGGSSLPPGTYLVTQLRVLVTYLRLLVFPAGQNLDYDYPLYSSLFSPAVIGATLILTAVAWCAVSLARRAARGGVDPAVRIVSFAVGWFLVTLLVEALVPLDDVIAEHRLYLASVAPCMAAAVSFAYGARRMGGANALLLGVCVVLALGTATVRRTLVWRTPLALWRDTVAKSPAKARPHYNLGTVLNDRGAHGEAVTELREAIRLDPRYAPAWHNLGIAQAARGEREEALRSYRTALSLEPDLAQAHNSLGVLFQEMGRVDEAFAEFHRAVVIDPLYAEARNNLGAAYGMRGMIDAAARELEKAVTLDPRNPVYLLNRERSTLLQRNREKPAQKTK